MMTFLTLRIEILNLNFCGAVRLPGGGQRWGGWNGIGGWMELTACFASLLASHGCGAKQNGDELLLHGDLHSPDHMAFTVNSLCCPFRCW
jgi:hypothetical protein